MMSKFISYDCKNCGEKYRLQSDLSYICECGYEYEGNKDENNNLKEKTWPQDGDYYWFINTSDGSYCVTEWQNNYMDKLLLSLGNIYKTQEEAINKRVYMMTDKAQKIARLNILIKELTEENDG